MTILNNTFKIELSDKHIRKSKVFEIVKYACLHIASVDFLGEGRRQGRKKRLASQPETNPADQQRIDAAVAAVNERYGTGAERQEKLSTVKFRGVTCRPSGKWQAQVYYGGKSRYVGVFDLEAEAALAYEAARELLEKSASGKDVCREKLTLGCSVGVTDDAMEIASNVSLARKAAFAIVS